MKLSLLIFNRLYKTKSVTKEKLDQKMYSSFGGNLALFIFMKSSLPEFQNRKTKITARIPYKIGIHFAGIFFPLKRLANKKSPK